MALPRVGGLVPAGARSELRAPHFPFLGSRTESFQFRRSSTVGHTRSHSEHGSQATCRRWYLAFGPGRVGRRRIHGPLRIRAGALLVLNDRGRFPRHENGCLFKIDVNSFKDSPKTFIKIHEDQHRLQSLEVSSPRR